MNAVTGNSPGAKKTAFYLRCAGKPRASRAEPGVEGRLNVNRLQIYDAEGGATNESSAAAVATKVLQVVQACRCWKPAKRADASQLACRTFSRPVVASFAGTTRESAACRLPWETDKARPR